MPHVVFQRTLYRGTSKHKLCNQYFWDISLLVEPTDKVFRKKHVKHIWAYFVIGIIIFPYFLKKLQPKTCFLFQRAPLFPIIAVQIVMVFRI